MNVYICPGHEVISGTNFLLNFLDSEDSNGYDLIIYENLSERDVFFSNYYHRGTSFFKVLNDKLISNNTKLVFILSAVPQEYYDMYSHSNIELIYAPLYFINYLINDCGIWTWDFNNRLYKRNFIDNSFDKLILNLNHRPHYHRCVMMDYLSKYNLLDVTAYTWNDNSKPYDFYEFKWWTPKINSITMDSDRYNCYAISYDNPVFHLVTESEITHISFSEKVFKPILAGIPFIVFGSKGFYKKLKDYGFELYDEVFDYSFDEFDDEIARAEAICTNFLNIKNKNYKEVIDTIYHKIEKNRNHALKIYSDKKFIPSELYDIYENHIKSTKDDESLAAYGHLNQYLF